MKIKLLFGMLILLAAIGLAAPASLSANTPADYWVDEATLPFPELAGYENATRMWGIHANAGYRIEVPADWNGDLVMWNHGLGGRVGTTRLFFDPVEEDLPLRNYLLANGYAWAASTYSKNDYSVSQAVNDTHALATFFHGAIGNPGRIYIAGRSLGAHIAAVSIEQYPSFYAGALPACGPLGGYKAFDGTLDLSVTAQQIALGSAVWPLDLDSYLDATVPQIKANLEAVPGGWPAILNADGAALKQLLELRSGGDRPNYDEGWFFYNVIPGILTQTPGNFMFEAGPYFLGSLPPQSQQIVDNVGVVYQTDLDPALSAYEQELNDSVLRVAADPLARQANGLPANRLPPLTGDIRVPVLALHILGDLVATFQNAIDYHEMVAAKGNSHLFVARAIRGVLHCGVNQSEWEAGFADLATWVESGVRPTGDVVNDPSVVAAPDYGCQHTDFAAGHLLATPCP